VCLLLEGSLITALAGCARQERGSLSDPGGAATAETQVEPSVSASITPASGDAGAVEKKEEEPEWADNSYCYVCHVNYDGEELTLNHEIAGVGCETCHGVSERHSADEDGITPPDRMFPRGKINAYCITCHAEADINHVSEHKPLFDATSGDTHVCTDCHGKHSMAVRTRIWDKETGKLISDDGVRMMYEDSPTRAKP